MTRSSNRISHVALMVKTENFAKAKDTYEQMLDIKFDGPFKFQDVLIYISFDAGIEICAPNPDEGESPLSQHLGNEGREGLWRLVFNTPDLAATLRRAKEMGYADNLMEVDAMAIAPEIFGRRFTKMELGFLTKPVFGVGLSLSSNFPFD